MVQLIIINGIGGSGKSTFCGYCKVAAQDRAHVYELSTVDYIKKVASMCGWNGGKTTKDRTFLSDLKMAFTKWNNAPINEVFNSIKRSIKESPEDNHIFFINSREPEDIEVIYNKAKKAGYPIIRILVHNPNIVVNEVPELIEGITSITYDKYIENDKDIHNLYKKAEEFITEILKQLK